LKKQFKDEESKQKSAAELKAKQAQEEISKLKKRVQELEAKDTKLEKDLTKEQQQAKQEQTHAQSAEAKVTTEHKAFLKASKRQGHDRAQGFFESK